MLYTAVLVACLASSSGAPDPASGTSDCRTHEMLIDGGANPMSAFIEAQSRAAEWLAEHPGLAQKSLIVRTGRGI